MQRWLAFHFNAILFIYPCQASICTRFAYWFTLFAARWPPRVAAFFLTHILLMRISLAHFFLLELDCIECARSRAIQRFAESIGQMRYLLLRLSAHLYVQLNWG